LSGRFRCSSSLLTWPGSAIVHNLVVPPSDISRAKPLIRLMLNQIDRRLTEEPHPKNRRHRVLLMLDEFAPSAASTSSSRRSPSWPAIASRAF
jgi:hypothetical protein